MDSKIFEKYVSIINALKTINHKYFFTMDILY
jgi:hypothetical protein